MIGTSFPHYDSGNPGAVASVEESLHRLRTDRVDVLLIHRPVQPEGGSLPACSARPASSREPATHSVAAAGITAMRKTGDM